jgi:protein phosphatase
LPNDQKMVPQVKSPSPECIMNLIDRSIGLLDKSKCGLLDVDGRLVTLPNAGEIILVGDLHGDLPTLSRIMDETRLIQRLDNGEAVYLVCLGDYIDRGPRQIETISFLLDLYVKHPDHVVLLRGNHEGPPDILATPHDFPTRLAERYGDEASEIYLSFQRLFNQLYTAALIEGNALLLHGGIPSEAKYLRDIAGAHLNHPRKKLLAEILWNDPSTLPGFNYSFRGIGRNFGIEVAATFLKKIGVNMLIRGHEACEEGHKLMSGKILTLFSCKLPEYHNKNAAYLQIPLDKAFDSETIRQHIHLI